MKLHIVLMHFDDHDPAIILGVAKTIEEAMDLALASENMYEDDKAKWEALDWEVENGEWTAHTNSSMGYYEIIKSEFEFEPA